MRLTRVWTRLLGLGKCVVVEDVELDEDKELIVRAHALRRRATKRRCGVCGEHCGTYEARVGSLTNPYRTSSSPSRMETIWSAE